MTEALIKDVVDSLCFTCCKRILHFQLFTITAGCENSRFFWIQQYLNEKKKKDADAPPAGCGVCFGLLEKYSQDTYLRQVR